MPMLWKEDPSHLLGKKLSFSNSVLQYNLRKFRDKPDEIGIIDTILRGKDAMGIIGKNRLCSRTE